MQRVYKKHKIGMHSKAGYTIRNAVVRPKDPLDLHEQCGVVYKSDCDICGSTYVGEMGRSLRERTEEHVDSIRLQDSKSAFSQHQETTGHLVNSKTPLMKKVRVLAREPQQYKRKLVEAIHIHLEKASLNRNDGLDLPEVYLPLLKEETPGERGATADQPPPRL